MVDDRAAVFPLGANDDRDRGVVDACERGVDDFAD